MRVTVITFKRVRQVRPYESASLEGTAELGEGEDPTVAVLDLARDVEQALDAHIAELQQQDARAF